MPERLQDVRQVRFMDWQNINGSTRTDWDERVAAWDPAADLENRVKQHRQRVERLKKEGRPIPDNQREEIRDLFKAVAY